MEREIGDGSYSRVFKARLVDDREVAVKVINPCKHENVPRSGSALEPKNKVPFVYQECVAMKELEAHPNVLKLIDAYVDYGQMRPSQVLVTEYCAGGDLIHQLEPHGARGDPWHEKRIFSVFAQLMAALMFMHRRGWVHRDVKLDNVMIHADGSVKLADFGYACRYRPGEHLSFQCGSPHYVSPEIASGLAFHGPDADYWAAFVVLHSMAYLTFPFKQTDRKNQVQVLESIKNNVRTVLSELRLSWQPQDLAGFINFGLFPNEGRIRRPGQVFADRWVSRMIGECERSPGAWCAHVGAFLLERDRCRDALERERCRTLGTEEDSFARFLDEHRLVANLSRMAVAPEGASTGSATLSSLETYPDTTASSNFPTPSPSLSFEPRCLAPTPTHALSVPSNRTAPSSVSSSSPESCPVSALEAACAPCSAAAEPESVARARVPPLEIERLRLPDAAAGPSRRSRARYRAMACLGCVSRSNS